MNIIKLLINELKLSDVLMYQLKIIGSIILMSFFCFSFSDLNVFGSNDACGADFGT